MFDPFEINKYICSQQAEYFCNSIGILQQYSTPSKFAGFDRSGSQTPQQQEGNCKSNYFDFLMLNLLLCSKLRHKKDYEFVYRTEFFN